MKKGAMLLLVGAFVIGGFIAYGVPKPPIGLIEMFGVPKPPIG